MLMAEPVMKAEREVREIRLTIHPMRIRPMNRMMAPAMIASADAI